jgi:hypothetical protein
MSKLLKLKPWLTIPETANYLSILFGEPVLEVDVFRLALDEYLKLSVNFVNKTQAKPGKKIPIEDAEFTEIHPIDGGDKIRMYKSSGIYHYAGKNPYVIQFEEVISAIKGVYDLPLYGSERLDIERAYQLQTQGAKVTDYDLQGVIVRANNGVLYQIQTNFDDNPFTIGSMAELRELKKRIDMEGIEDIESQQLLNQHKKAREIYLNKRSGKYDDPENYFPSNSLPEDSFLVVRTEILRNFELSIIEGGNLTEKPLATSERNTLLTIIAALCDYSKIDHQGRGAAAQIARLTEASAVQVSDDTVGRVLKKIPNALESRKK